MMLHKILWYNNEGAQLVAISPQGASLLDLVSLPSIHSLNAYLNFHLFLYLFEFWANYDILNREMADDNVEIRVRLEWKIEIIFRWGNYKRITKYLMTLWHGKALQAERQNEFDTFVNISTLIDVGWDDVIKNCSWEENVVETMK